MTEWDRAAHLKAALEEAEDDDARYHIRQALQYEEVERGELEDTAEVSR